jgi:hypothetical protein
MVVIPRYQPVFVEPNHKEYETQVSYREVQVSHREVQESHTEVQVS